MLRLHVQPGAKRTEVSGLHGDALKIRLAAPPVEGKANAALLAYIALRFGVSVRNVTLLSGEKSREKRVEVRGSDFDPHALIVGDVPSPRKIKSD
ncbi:YggU family protein [Betaproteobacteria bacterium GR16-43]|nr:YggU family protein [Betaproteobacteria bacterium GR16-43]